MLNVTKERIKEDYYRVGHIVTNMKELTNEQQNAILESVDLLVKNIKDNTKMIDNTEILEEIDFNY